jgi:hypothetical protein
MTLINCKECEKKFSNLDLTDAYPRIVHQQQKQTESGLLHGVKSKLINSSLRITNA